MFVILQRLLCFYFVSDYWFVFVDCLISFVLAKLSAVAISRPFFGINIPRSVSSVSVPTRVNQASVPDKSSTHGFTFCSFVKPGQGALKES